MQATNSWSSFEVTTDGAGVVGHAGAALLRELADLDGLTAALGWRGPQRRRHPEGAVLRDLAVLLADGGDCLSDLAVLRDQPALFGPVASTATAWRVVDRVASFLGRRIRYVNEITELTGDQLVMRSVRSPFPMRVTYGHRRAGDGATEVSVRVEGDAGRYYALLAPLLGVAVRRSIARDLRNLKRVLEGRPRPSSR